MQGSKLKRAASIAEGTGHKSRTAGQPPGHLARYRPHARVAHVRHCRQPLRARRAPRGARRDRRRRPRLARGTVAGRAAGALRSAVALLGADSGAGTAAATGNSRPAQVGGSCGGPRKAGADDAAAASQALPQFLRPIYLSEVTARLREAVSTDRPFIERLTQFWSNHFAVSVDKQLLSGLAGSFEREAIRPQVLGRFSDLLLAVETHPAMLLYLDNHLSSARIRRRRCAWSGARGRAGSASTRISRARFSSCTPSVWAGLHAGGRDHLRRSDHRLVGRR